MGRANGYAGSTGSPRRKASRPCPGIASETVESSPEGDALGDAEEVSGEAGQSAAEEARSAAGKGAQTPGSVRKGGVGSGSQTTLGRGETEEDGTEVSFRNKPHSGL